MLQNDSLMRFMIYDFLHEGIAQEGHAFEADRNGINIHFNLTSKQGQHLVSVMKIMVLDDNGTDLINNATVSCGSAGEERYPHAVLSAFSGMQLCHSICLI